MPITPRERVSAALLHFDARDLTPTPRTGQGATWARTTSVTITDSVGATVARPHSAPAWHYVSGQGPCWWLGANDAGPVWGFAALPSASTWYAAFVETTVPSAQVGARVWEVGTGSGARLLVARTASGYEATHHNGTSSVTASVTVSVSANQLVELRLTLAATGAIQLGASVAGGAETVGTASGTLALAAAWGGATLSANQNGAAGDRGVTHLRQLLVLPDVVTLAACRTVAG